MKKKYHILTPDKPGAKKLLKSLKCHPVIADILINRRISTPEDAAEFFSNDLKYLRSPMDIRDMDTAVDRITRALVKKEKILVFGDYDADGITATALFHEFFRRAGADSIYYIPHRTREGYGLDKEHIHRVAVPNKINLIVTVDCGSTSHEAAAAARRSGIDVIITDHHHVAPPFPPVEAFVNPNRPDCDAGFDMLAGVGVAYAVLICLRKHLRENDFWASRPEPNLKVLCDLVALGTVADIVPLRKENRLFTKTGLEVIGSGIRPGIKALWEESGLESLTLTAEDIAFRLAPRINAAGRIAHAVCAVKLLTTRDEKKARRIAATLNRLNRKRQSKEQTILSQVLAYIQANPTVLQKNALVLKHPEWHEGILGIVAAKLVERFYRPVVLISIKNGTGKGSARSIPGFDLYDGLTKSSRYLDRFGGHAMAAGLRIQADRIDEFREAFETVVTENTSREDFFPVVTIDRALSFDDITPDLVEALETLQPFGQDNPEPIFMARNVSVAFSKIVGLRHRQLRLKQSGARTGGIFNAIQFNINPEEPPPTFLEQIAFRLHWNIWKGRKNIQLVIEAT